MAVAAIAIDRGASTEASRFMPSPLGRRFLAVFGNKLPFALLRLTNLAFSVAGHLADAWVIAKAGREFVLLGPAWLARLKPCGLRGNMGW